MTSGAVRGVLLAVQYELSRVNYGYRRLINPVDQDYPASSNYCDMGDTFSQNVDTCRRWRKIQPDDYYLEIHDKDSDRVRR